MVRKRNFIIGIGFLLIILIFTSIPAFAITAEEVEQQVAAQGKEVATGNILVWFLCAVSFLKVSQKIDSFMSSLGINVGKTGGSMLAEAMIAGRAVSRGIGGLTGAGGSGGFNNNRDSSSLNPLSGGLAGTVGRMVTESAAVNVTGKSESVTSEMARGIYENSIKGGGDFATSVISKVTTGNIAKNGSIKGNEASEAFRHYMGANQSAETSQNLQMNHAADVDNQNPQTSCAAEADNQNLSEQTEPFDNFQTQNNDEFPYMFDDTDIPIAENGMEGSEIYDSIPVDGLNDLEQDNYAPATIDSDFNSVPDMENATALSESTSILNGNSGELSTNNQSPQESASIHSNAETNGTQIHQDLVSSELPIESSIGVGESFDDASNSREMSSNSDWLSDSPIVSNVQGVSETANIEPTSQYMADDISEPGSYQSSMADDISESGGYQSSTADNISEPGGYQSRTNVLREGGGMTPNTVGNSSIEQSTVSLNDMGNKIELQNNFKDVEMGGGRITGTEISEKNPSGIRFAMYHTDQYSVPEDKFSVIKAVDGSKWYHQYAKNVVVKEPFMDAKGKIQYDESIQKKLPPAPKRKDRI